MRMKDHDDGIGKERDDDRDLLRSVYYYDLFDLPFISFSDYLYLFIFGVS